MYLNNNRKPIREIWDYFSGYSYKSTLLKDFGFLNEKNYSELIRVLCQRKKLPASCQELRLTMNDLKDGCDNLVWEDEQKGSALFVHNCQRIFKMLLLLYIPLQMKRVELKKDLVYPFPWFIPKTLDILNQSFYSTTVLNNQDQRLSQFVEFITRTISDIDANALKPSAKDKEHIRVLQQGLSDIIPELADTLMLQIQTQLFGLIATIPKDEEHSPAALFYHQLMRVFNLRQKELSPVKLYDKELQLLDLVDKALVWHPSANVMQSIAFDRVPDMKKWIVEKRDWALFEALFKLSFQAPKTFEKQSDFGFVDEKDLSKSAQILNAMDGEGFSSDLFLKLGLMNEKEYAYFCERLNAHSDCSTSAFSLQETFPSRVFDTSGKVAAPEDVLISFNDEEQQQAMTFVCFEMEREGWLENFSPMSAFDVLKAVNASLMMKSIERGLFNYADFSAQVLTHRMNALELNTDTELLPIEDKFFYFSSLVSGTVSDLKNTVGSEEKGNGLHEKLKKVLRGVPEYFYYQQKTHLDSLNAYNLKIVRGNLSDNQSTYAGRMHSFHQLRAGVDLCFDVHRSDKKELSSQAVKIRLKQLEKLTRVAIAMNPKWKIEQKDIFWDKVAEAMRGKPQKIQNRQFRPLLKRPRQNGE